MIVMVPRSNKLGRWARLLTDPLAVKRFLVRIDEPCVDWIDFSTAERCNDDTWVQEVIGDGEDVVVWKFLTTDGVEAHVFIRLAVQHGEIDVKCRLEESEGATLWRLFRPLIDYRIEKLGRKPPKAQKMDEYAAELRKSL